MAAVPLVILVRLLGVPLNTVLMGVVDLYRAPRVVMVSCVFQIIAVSSLPQLVHTVLITVVNRFLGQCDQEVVHQLLHHFLHLLLPHLPQLIFLVSLL